MPASRSRIAPNTLGESIRGRHIHSTLPLGATSARRLAVRQEAVVRDRRERARADPAAGVEARHVATFLTGGPLCRQAAQSCDLMPNLESAPADAADAAAVTEIVAALESSLYGADARSRRPIWRTSGRSSTSSSDARVVRDGDRIVGYGVVRERGELWRAEGYVHPDARGRGIGRLIATGLEEDAARRGARRIQNSVFEADAAARSAARVARLRRRARLPRDAHRARGAAARTRVAGRAARRRRSTRSATRASSTPRTRRRSPITGTTRRATSTRGRRPPRGASASTRRSGASSAPGTRSPPGRSAPATPTAAASSTRSSRAARGASRASARRCSRDAFGRFWERGERSVGLGVDAANDTGAFRLYERAGMTPALGWVMYEKQLAG